VGAARRDLLFNGADLIETQSILVANQNSMAGFVGWSGLGDIARITFATDGGAFPLIDNLRYGGVLGEVPEPATLALFGAGLVGLDILARRRTAA
jgi:hypothetical protein